MQTLFGFAHPHSRRKLMQENGLCVCVCVPAAGIMKCSGCPHLVRTENRIRFGIYIKTQYPVLLPPGGKVVFFCVWAGLGAGRGAGDLVFVQSITHSVFGA